MLCRKLTLIGVGLLGGSLGMAVRARRLAGFVQGYVRRETSVVESQEAGAVDAATTDLQAAVGGADLIVLCTPVGQMRPLVRQCLPAISRGAVVTDVGSVKDGLTQDLEGLVQRAGARFVGSHPMAGAEKTGVANGRANMFEGAVCVVTPLPESSVAALRRVKALWRGVGARIISLAPAVHDDLVSRSSHLPHILAVQLVNHVLGPGRPKEQALLCANGFRDTTRIASGSPDMWRDIALANRSRLARAITEFVSSLTKFRAALLAANRPEIEAFLRGAKDRRDRWAARTDSPE